MKERTELELMLGNMLADPVFFQVDQRLRAPNLFSIFSMEYQKSRYSSLLAYFLNPNENHGLEDSFLRQFLSHALKSMPAAADKDPDSLSPIPYAKVKESILDWDQLDVLSADLRETMVTTDYPLGEEGRTVDICIWNEPYSFAVYVENLIVPKEGWRRYHGSGMRSQKSLTGEYVLDLYRRWASDQNPQPYQILPVSLRLGSLRSAEQHVTRQLEYPWMIDVLNTLVKSPTVASHTRLLITDFIEHLRCAYPEFLEMHGLTHQLSQLVDQYGPAICRLFDHVAECSGCDSDDDLITAYHDIYRRHRACVEALWLHADSVSYPLLTEIRGQIEAMRFDEDMVLYQTASSLSGTCKRWMEETPRNGDEEVRAPAEIYFSASVGSCGIFVYQEPSRGMVDKIWFVAREIAEEMEMELSEHTPTSRNFHLAKKYYDAFSPIEIARDFIRFYKLMDDIFKELHR
ncbi:PD-(D/E)XK nuclease family protein [Myxococcota bacterium]|nr:PD-(D/E)XK nuclease family protein [Myxococcota bacterium]MBU1412326.1 PD-(D/E)XK nuclease family protein [Myxococcota bacterium]MBU1511029.1 PD-(D/E)XK nuclease family protein [Myxococcota bacterium]PKN24278.1 MAG: hypothetical protein CVU65_12220 [Deltaproteobacteria bacterium HGW-Deltaproteobacteria-22]